MKDLDIDSKKVSDICNGYALMIEDAGLAGRYGVEYEFSKDLELQVMFSGKSYCDAATCAGLTERSLRRAWSNVVACIAAEHASAARKARDLANRVLAEVTR